MITIRKHKPWFGFLIFILGGIVAGCNMPTGNLPGAATATTPPTMTPIELPTVQTMSISGRIWHDLCALPGEGQAMPAEPPPGCVSLDGGFQADGVRESDEPGIAGLEVGLGLGPCPSMGFATATTDAEGVFRFEGLEPRLYCLTIDAGHPKNAQILIPGQWTSGPADASGLISVTIDLGEGGLPPALEFGWDYQFLPPYTAPATEVPSATATVELTSTPTPTPEMTTTATPTPSSGDTSLPTGNPDWKDTFDSGVNWPLYEDEHVRFAVKDGKAVMTAFNADYYEGWMLSWPDLKDFYLQGIFTTGECSGRDRFGLMARSTAPAGIYVGYLYAISCDGRYSLRTWNGEKFTEIIPWTANEAIQTGSNKTYRLGLRAEADELMLYVDGKRLAQIHDDTYTEGKFGVFIGAGQTVNLQVEIDEIAYWTLP
jgi:hypothetical protein